MISDSLLNLKMMKLLINKERVTVEAQIKQQTKHRQEAGGAGVWGWRGGNAWRGFSVVIGSTLEVCRQLECLMVTKSEPLLWLWIAPSQAPSAASSHQTKAKIKKENLDASEATVWENEGKDGGESKTNRYRATLESSERSPELKIETSVSRVCAATERLLHL